jgi:hypothetical protein
MIQVRLEYALSLASFSRNRIVNGRLYTIAVLLFWLVSAGWLVRAKVWPALVRGNPPEYRQEFADKPREQRLAVGWDLYWNKQPVGFAVSKAFGTSEEPQEIRSYVRFEKIKLQQVLNELLGGMTFLANMLGNNDFDLNLSLASELRLNWEGELQSFQTCIKAEDDLNLLFLRGQRTEQDRLKISILTGDDSATETVPLTHEFALPAQTHYSDAFSPRSRMVGLTVGQKWTTPVISPMAASNSIRLVESVVEKKERITWDEAEVDTFVIAYRNESLPGESNRKPAGYAWVREDGFVVRQELMIGNARIRFERMPEGPGQQRAEILESGRFEHYVHRHMSKLKTHSLAPKQDATDPSPDATSQGGLK